MHSFKRLTLDMSVCEHYCHLSKFETESVFVWSETFTGVAGTVCGVKATSFVTCRVRTTPIHCRQFVPCFKAKTVQAEKWQQNWVLLRKNRFSKLESDPSQLGHTTKFLSHHWHQTNVRHNLGEVLGVYYQGKTVLFERWQLCYKTNIFQLFRVNLKCPHS